MLIQEQIDAMVNGIASVFVSTTFFYLISFTLLFDVV